MGVALSYKLVPSKGLRERLGLDDISTAKQVAMVWACTAKRRQ